METLGKRSSKLMDNYRSFEASQRSRKSFLMNPNDVGLETEVPGSRALHHRVLGPCLLSSFPWHAARPMAFFYAFSCFSPSALAYLCKYVCIYTHCIYIPDGACVPYSAIHQNMPKISKNVRCMNWYTM